MYTVHVGVSSGVGTKNEKTQNTSSIIPYWLKHTKIVLSLISAGLCTPKLRVTWLIQSLEYEQDWGELLECVRGRNELGHSGLTTCSYGNAKILCIPDIYFIPLSVREKGNEYCATAHDDSGMMGEAICMKTDDLR